jgi:hypothetical protein
MAVGGCGFMRVVSLAQNKGRYASYAIVILVTGALTLRILNKTRKQHPCVLPRGCARCIWTPTPGLHVAAG